jgi:protease-4
LCLSVVLIGGLLPGCKAPSLLITPVSGRKELVETSILRDGAMSRDKIVLIEVSGLIRNSDSGFILNPRDNPVSVLLEHLDKASCDDSVKAVILRINSPGGTVVASELMHDEIVHFREKTGKPVVAVMMDLATSGGYYIACACDEIVAQPSTVTGSIGVLMLMFDASGTMNKIGLRSEAITSGRYKDAGSPLRPLAPEERELFRTMVVDMYERFVTVVRAGRPRLSEDAVRKLADGRVYTATQALDAGLIDRIASLREVTCGLRDELGLRGVKLVTYQRPYEYTPNYYASAPAGPASSNVNFLNINVPGAFLPRAPEFLYLWAPEYSDVP